MGGNIDLNEYILTDSHSVFALTSILELPSDLALFATFNFFMPRPPIFVAFTSHTSCARSAA